VTPVGVVVLTHTRVEDLLTTLAHFEAVAEPVRLVVVDNASTDGTRALLGARFPRVPVVSLPANVGAAGRNAGVAALDTPYVAFCDDDCWWAPGALARAAAILDAHPALGLVCGRVLVGREAREDPACTEMAASPLVPVPGLPGVPILGFLCAATMVRRDALLAAGGFEPRFFLGGEEELLAIDLAVAGWRLAYVPEIVVHHHPSPRRDAPRRQVQSLRNALWTAWLRRAAPDAWRRSRAVLARSTERREQVAAVAAALRELPWVLRHRRPVPPHIEDALRRLDDYAERRRRRRGVVVSGVVSGVASGSRSRLAR
jgi:GT2 family glycosyltransferase